MQVVTLSTWVDQWLDDIAATHASISTVRSYRVAANSFSSFALIQGDTVELDAELILRYVSTLRRLSPRTQHSYTGGLLRFLEYLIGQGIIPGIRAEHG